PPTANRTVSSAGPPSRSSSSAIVTFVAIPGLLAALGYLHRTRSTALPRPPRRAKRRPAQPGTPARHRIRAHLLVARRPTRLRAPMLTQVAGVPRVPRETPLSLGSQDGSHRAESSGLLQTGPGIVAAGRLHI